MQSPLETEARSEKIARSIETKKDIAELREQLKRVVESNAFRGSHRSAQFLKYTCEQAIAGHLDSLKERAIGVELFGRSPSYDTGEDAIVRVTASDVRRRLSHYYLSNPDSAATLRITIPVGSYIPEVHRDIQESPHEDPVDVASGQPLQEAATSVSVKPEENAPLSNRTFLARVSWLLAFAALALISLSVWAILQRSTQAGIASTTVFPWSVLFAEKHSPLLVTSDPNIAEVQGLTGQPVSISDYANQQYIRNPAALSPEIVDICLHTLRGDKAASVDTPIVAGIAELAAQNQSQVHVRAARDLHFSDLDTDSNLIFLGSPRTNPWTSLFDDQLDFRFLYNNATRLESIQNAHPHSGESTEYVPTAKGFATGQSFATVSFVRNPNHAGNILILAGANAEGTKASGELVTNLSSLKTALQRCGIQSFTADSPQHFQILLHLKMMAGSPTAFDVAACHLLP